MQKTLLEYMEEQGMPIESSCRAGICGQCRVKVKGDIRFLREQIGFRAADEVLACCVNVTESNLEL
ncbi:2Fe-2S iron-sulfur cluster-binding protein [Enterovibrio norvegicus]|uniref:2Fe-2S iron-sulfur cluster-binding protein n=1 Tax=Enterovibrio norvegicus TaxID=188144 RepID=UPI00352EE030